MKKNNSILESMLYKIGLRKRKKEKTMRNYSILVDSFNKKVYSQYEDKFL